MPTLVSYEEWKLLPGASLPAGALGDHPEWFEFGKDDDGKPVARMTKEGSEAYAAALKTTGVKAS